mmetsp:Transcript_76378/g.212177  ORF Transcript_76378/g.212177 Transcript_76378/m.212177 type:complete len:210 (+) Transcript_76378:271-900(+)
MPRVARTSCNRAVMRSDTRRIACFVWPSKCASHFSTVLSTSVVLLLKVASLSPIAALVSAATLLSWRSHRRERSSPASSASAWRSRAARTAASRSALIRATSASPAAWSAMVSFSTCCSRSSASARFLRIASSTAKRSRRCFCSWAERSCSRALTRSSLAFVTASASRSPCARRVVASSAQLPDTSTCRASSAATHSSRDDLSSASTVS